MPNEGLENDSFMNIENRVIENIDKNKDSIVKFLRDLISFPSVTGNELKIQQLLQKNLKK